MKTQIEPLLTVKLGLPSVRLQEPVDLRTTNVKEAGDLAHHQRGDLRFDLNDVIQFIESRKASP